MELGSIGPRQGEVWIADLGEPVGSVAGYIRPVVIVQGDLVNASRLASFLAIPLTSNLRHARIPTNYMVAAKGTGLARDSVAQPTLMLPVAEEQLIEQVGRIPQSALNQIFARLDTVLGRA